jgi:hypothetical protein
MCCKVMTGTEHTVKRGTHIFEWENLKDREHLKDLDVDRRMTLTWSVRV